MRPTAVILVGWWETPDRHRELAEINTAIAHLRDVVGDAVYKSLAPEGETMTTAEMATYADDQIDRPEQS